MTIDKIHIPGRLCTKDGRKVGNAYCIKAILPRNIATAATIPLEIETDYGNILVMSAKEASTLWYSILDEPPTVYDTWKAGKK